MIKSEEIFDESRFRANVGIMIVNDSRLILAGEVCHDPGLWMMPQGGIDFPETPVEAMKRELAEETTLEFADTTLLKEHDEWMGYRLGRPLERNGNVYIGQRQKWFLLHYSGVVPDAALAVDQEFRNFDWVEREWLLKHTSRIKQQVYAAVFRDFESFLP